MPGRVVLDTFASALLADNPLGDPATRTFPIYLPPGYDDEPARRYPVLFVLAGYSGLARAVENVSPWSETLSQRLDRLIEREGCPPVIVVSPDCFTRYGGSQYLDSSATGRYESYLCDEVVDHVDATYRTLAEPAGRGVLGKSSGGFGALHLTMRRPDVFGALASHSGDAAFELCYQPDFPKVIAALGAQPDPLAFVEAFVRKEKKPSRDFDVMNILCMAACYSPNPDTPWGFDLPFDPYTGERLDDVWARWKTHDPVQMAALHADALRTARLVFIDAGTADDYQLHLGARQLVARLTALGVAHEHEEFPDNHFGLSYRYDVSIPKLARALSPG
jgi:S-formylglutathione hydrolase FrmB